MNNKHLLVKCLTLLFQSSQLPNRSDASSSLVERALEQVKLPEVVTGLETERELLQNLMNTVRNLLKHPSDKISATEMYQQVIVDCADDLSMREAIQAGIVPGLSEEEVHALCASIRRDLNQYLRDEKGKQVLLSYADQVRFKSSETTDLPKMFFSLSSELEPYYTNSQEDDPAVVASFGIGDKKAIVDVFAKIKERNEGRGGFRFGFRGINRFFKGTLEEGKFVVIGALQHQHKTGFSLALFRQLLMYNLPIIREWEVKPSVIVEAELEINSRYKTDDEALDEALQDALDEELRGLYNRQLPYTEEQAVFYDDLQSATRVPVRMNIGQDPFMGGKPKHIPCMIRISTEDEIEDNMEKLYKDIYGNVEGKGPDMRFVSDSDMEEYLTEQLGRNGWYAHFMRINPSEWTYQNIVQTVLDLEAKGYDVRCVMIDYLPMIPTTGCEQGPAGHDLRDMYRRVRNFLAARSILGISPHQLSSDAMRLIRQGVSDFVKGLPDRNYYAGSTQISHEVDGEIFIHIEKVNGVSWLTCQRGKYRSPKVVDDKDKYIALPFTPEYGLQDDLLREELGRKSPGATVNASGAEEAPFWEMM